jgi:membrane associated rhomboid family serine protease
MFQPQSNNQAPSISSQIQNWWSSVPFMTKLILLFCSLSFIIDLISSRFFFLNCFDSYLLTIRKFQIWRVFTPWIVHQDVLQLLFSLLSVYHRFLQLERAVGSTVFFLDFLLKNIEIQVLFLILSYIFNVLFHSLFFSLQTSSGLWTIVMLYICINGFTNPNQEAPLLCFPVNIKAKFLPFILMLFFAFTNEFLSMLSALIIGFTETRFFEGMLLRISHNRVLWIEEKILKRWIYRSDFISAQNVNSAYFVSNNNVGRADSNINTIHNLSTNSSNNGFNNSNNNISTQNTNSNNERNNLSAFQGKGVVIGSSEKKEVRGDKYVELNVEEEKKTNENNSTLI